MARKTVKLTSHNVSRSVPLNVIRVPIGIFFFILGLYGVIPTIDEGPFSLAPSWGVLEFIFGVAEIAAGIIILAGLVTILSRKTMKLVSLAVLIFWLSRIVISKFIFALTYMNTDFALWLLVLAAEAIIAAALYIFYRSYPANS